MESESIVLIVIASLVFGYLIVRTACAHEARIRKLKLEADLKKKLAEHIQDPDAIERILKLEGLGAVEKGKDPAGDLVRNQLELQARATEQARERMEARHARRLEERNDPQRQSRRFVFPGLVCMLVGVCLVLADQLALSKEAEGLSFPGIVTFAVGLAMMSYSVWLQDTARREESAAPR